VKLTLDYTKATLGLAAFLLATETMVRTRGGIRRDMLRKQEFSTFPMDLVIKNILKIRNLKKIT
jgi:hypothetical protein